MKKTDTGQIESMDERERARRLWAAYRIILMWPVPDSAGSGEENTERDCELDQETVSKEDRL